MRTTGTLDDMVGPMLVGLMGSGYGGSHGGGAQANRPQGEPAGRATRAVAAVACRGTPADGLGLRQAAPEQTTRPCPALLSTTGHLCFRRCISSPAGVGYGGVGMDGRSGSEQARRQQADAARRQQELDEAAAGLLKQLSQRLQSWSGEGAPVAMGLRTWATERA